MTVLADAIRWIARDAMRRWSRTGRAPGWCYQVVERWGPRVATSPLETCLFNGCRMRCSLQDQVQRQIYFFGAYEPVEAHLFERLIHPGMVVVDAGANVGQYALLAAARVGQSGQVHAFEPVPATYARLRDHVRLNRLDAVVRANAVALWHREEPLAFSLPADMAGNAGAYRTGPVPQSIDTVTAPGIRLDDYVAHAGLARVDVIKLDVEGAELRVLEGAMATLARCRPVLLMEVDRSLGRRLGCQPEDIWSLLEPLGYRAWRIGDSPEACGGMANPDRLERANVLFFVEPLAADVTAWSLRSLLQSHRRQASRHERRVRGLAA